MLSARRGELGKRGPSSPRRSHTPAFYRHRPGHPHPADQLADLFTADIQVGVDRYDYTGPIVDRTGHRAGVIKVATAGDHRSRPAPVRGRSTPIVGPVR
jgi:hypothetical protein